MKQKNNLDKVIIWGSGLPRREFLYVDDMAETSLYLHNLDQARYLANTKPIRSHVNVGTGKDITIKELAETIMNVVHFNGELIFDLLNLMEHCVN